MGDDDSSTPLLNSASSKEAPAVSSLSYLLTDWWLWEIIEASISILALSVIAIILSLYDGSPLPDWPSVFTVRLWSSARYSTSLIILHR